MSVQRQQVTLWLPWFSVEDELEYSAMTLFADGAVDRRLAKRLVRKWYKDKLGVTACDRMLRRVWKHRIVQRVLTEQEIAQRMHDMARETYEETVRSADTDTQEKAPS